jgi:hypothetical protein
VLFVVIFCCHLFVVIFCCHLCCHPCCVGLALFGLSSLSFLLLPFGCLLLIPDVCSLFIIVALIRFLCVERIPTGGRVCCFVVWFFGGSDVKGYLRALVLLVQFSYLFLVLQSRTGGVLETGSASRCLYCVTIIWFVMFVLALALSSCMYGLGYHFYGVDVGLCLVWLSFGIVFLSFSVRHCCFVVVGDDMLVFVIWWCVVCCVRRGVCFCCFVLLCLPHLCRVKELML